jgi:hypothetical protein
MLLAAGVVLSACTGATEVPIEPAASFEARVTGGVNRTMRGAARFSKDAVGDADGLAVMLVEPVAPGSFDRARHAIYLHREQPGGPATGEFRVIEGRDIPDARPTDFVAEIVMDADQTNGIVCQAVTGTLTLTPLANLHLLGSFVISARCTRVGGPGTDDPVELTGSFDAEAAVVAIPDVTAPAMGSYALADVGGQPVPAIVSVGVDEGSWFQVIATSGRITIDATGHYEQLVKLEASTDGMRTGRWNWVDRGICERDSGAHLVCSSEYFENVAFTASVGPLGIETMQDVVGDGVNVRFRYRRTPPP